MQKPRTSRAEFARTIRASRMRLIREKQELRLADAETVLEKKKGTKARGRYASKSVYERACIESPDCIAFFPTEELTPEICMRTVMTAPTAISFIPKKFRTEELSRAALEACDVVYKKENEDNRADHIMEVLQSCEQTEALCLQAISQMPYDKNSSVSCGFLSVIHDQTDAICKAAAQRMPYEVMFIRPENLKEEYIDIAIEHSDGDVIELLDLTEERCLKAVAQRGSNLSYMQDMFYNEALGIDARKVCLTALENNALSLRHIPKEFRSEEFCSFAVQQEIGALADVPDELITKELFDKIVESGTYAQKIRVAGEEECVPAGHWCLSEYWSRMSEDTICAFLRETEHGLKYIPEHKITKRECFESLRCSSTSAVDIPDTRLSADLSTAFLKRFEEEHLSHDKITPSCFRRVASAALRSDGMLLALCPERVFTEGFVKIAVKQNADAYRLVPKTFQTEKVQVQAISENAELLRDTAHPTSSAIRCALSSDADYAAVEPYLRDLSGEEVCNALEEFGVSLRK